MQTYGELPADPNHPLPDGTRDRIVHALLKVGETDLMFSDTVPGMPSQSGNQVTIALHTNEAAKAKQMFEALAEGGQVTLPFQETFLSPGYGQVTDKFGVGWQVNTEVNG